MVICHSLKISIFMCTVEERANRRLHEVAMETERLRDISERRISEGNR